ncbi:hypothetical protein KIPB_007555 [Kipferlia bialata]|uniref:Uncharacterized protein n=1 Tax=Kipferlia bialata TaxID=797122 RepID=A0A9K3D0G1_9EUKA|nr:hypothetical protein KIPB_007555 [Kipferlia bialata]|eukprot:g7555.t1
MQGSIVTATELQEQAEGRAGLRWGKDGKREREREDSRWTKKAKAKSKSKAKTAMTPTAMNADTALFTGRREEEREMEREMEDDRQWTTAQIGAFQRSRDRRALSPDIDTALSEALGEREGRLSLSTLDGPGLSKDRLRDKREVLPTLDTWGYLTTGNIMSAADGSVSLRRALKGMRQLSLSLSAAFLLVQAGRRRQLAAVSQSVARA